MTYREHRIIQDALIEALIERRWFTLLHGHVTIGEPQ